jgi:hypothetical protein
MAVSNANKNKLNKMNRAAQDAQLGEHIQNAVFAGAVVPSAAQITGSAITVYNALATNGMYMIDVYRSGSKLALNNAYKATRTGGSLVIAVVNSGSFTANDVVNYIIG